MQYIGVKIFINNSYAKQKGFLYPSAYVLFLIDIYHIVLLIHSAMVSVQLSKIVVTVSAKFSNECKVYATDFLSLLSQRRQTNQ